jgi:hypothetical protein
MWSGIYFIKRTANKIQDFFKTKKYIEDEILILVNPNEKPKIGAKDVYYLLYGEKPEAKRVQSFYQR